MAFRHGRESEGGQERGRLITGRRLAGAVGGAGLLAFAYGTAFAYQVAQREIVTYEGEVNMDEATITTESILKKYENAPAISISTLAIDQTLQAEGVKFEARMKPRFDVGVLNKLGDALVPDYTGNKELSGQIDIRTLVPAEAIVKADYTKDEINDTTVLDMEIDGAALEADVHWNGSDPQIRNYTIKDGDRKYETQHAGWNQINNASGQVKALLGSNGLKNLLTDLDDRANNQLKLLGLQTYMVECMPELEEHNINAIEESVTVMNEALNVQADTINVEVVNLPLKFEVEQPAKVTKKDDGKNVTDFTVPELEIESSCSISEGAIKENAEGTE